MWANIKLFAFKMISSCESLIKLLQASSILTAKIQINITWFTVWQAYTIVLMTGLFFIFL